MYDILFEKFIKSKIPQLSISKELKAFLSSSMPAVIFGCGDQGRISMDLCHMFHKNVYSFLVSEGGKRICPYWLDFPFYQLGDFPSEMKESVDVLISVNEKYNSEIAKNLKEEGFKNIFCVENWTEANEALRKEWHGFYFSFQQMENPDKIFWESDKNGRILKVKLNERFFKMYYSDDPLEQSNVLGNFCDVALPSLFEDNRYVTEGPYEYGKVTLEKGDVVFDLGSNFGMFSSVALAKECFVHAFEPTPVIAEYLKKYLSISEGEYHIWPYAVTDTTGETTFNLCHDTDGNYDLGRNSILSKRDTSSSIVVQTITLDKFVEKNNISDVNFIKADIEGAERYMLMGAKQVLKEFAPKLSLCTYHLPDDPQVMEHLILEANPNYVIEHKWSKLYAYCPER